MVSSVRSQSGISNMSADFIDSVILEDSKGGHADGQAAAAKRCRPSTPPSTAAARAGGPTVKTAKRRSRASVKPPVRVLSADKSNFRDMVQKLTGFPTCRRSVAASSSPSAHLHRPFLSSHLPQHPYYRLPYAWTHIPHPRRPLHPPPAAHDNYRHPFLHNILPSPPRRPFPPSSITESLPTIDTSSAYLNMAPIRNPSNSTSSNDPPPVATRTGSIEDLSKQSYANISAGFGDCGYYGGGYGGGVDSDGEISGDYRSKSFPMWSSTIDSGDHSHTYGGSMASTEGNSYDLDAHLVTVDGILQGADSNLNADVNDSLEKLQIIRSKAAELESLIMSNDNQLGANYDADFPSLFFNNSVDGILQQFPPSWLSSSTDLLHNMNPTPRMIA